MREHFCCATETIAFSNDIFHDEQLIPLWMPMGTEWLTPSLMDVRVNGSKVAKANEEECNTIVSMIRDFVAKSDSETFPRTIGVISLVGNEQSRLIRGRLLDVIGPQKYKEHDILIGDPPTFQGAERDIIFLSMICSPGRVPTQNQLMHAQRANVALSRARDRMVLVRSIDSSHVPSGDDVKIPILEFFSEAASDCSSNEDEQDGPRIKDGGLFSFRMRAQSLLEERLRSKGYSVRRMGVVWNDAVCVEDKASDTRAALCFECVGELTEEWSCLVKQQKSIERVGWKTLRVDGLSFLVNFRGTFKSIENFLQNAGVMPSVVEEEEEEAVEEEGEELGDVSHEAEAVEPVWVVANAEDDIVVVSDREDAGSMSNDAMDPAQYGDLASLEFLRGSEDSDVSVIDDPYHPQDRRTRSRDTDRTEVVNMDSDDDEDDDKDNDQRMNSPVVEDVARAPNDKNIGDSSDDSYVGGHRKRQRTRMDKYSRDGRWYPAGRKPIREEDDEKEWYDTDSDLPSSSKPAARDSSGHVDTYDDSDDERGL